MRYIKTIIAAMLFTLAAVLPQEAVADASTDFDVASCEAMIYYHKRVGNALEGRMIAEGVVKKKHEKMKDGTIHYEAGEKEADKLYQPGLLSVIMNGGAALLGTVHAGAFLVKRVRGFWDILDEYNEKVLKKKKIMASDIILYTAMDSMSRQLYREGKKLLDNQWYFGLYLSGTSKITAADLSNSLLAITETLERMEAIVDQAYDTMWYYMLMRTGPWNSDFYYVRSAQRQADVIAAARAQWLEAIRRTTAVPAGGDGMVNPTTPSESARHLEREETDRKIHKALQEVRIGA